MIRVLHVVSKMNRGGLETRLMDLFRNIDRSRCVFDFYTNSLDTGEYDEEIRQLGGKVFKSSPLTPFNIAKKTREFQDFCSEHSEYSIVHCHMNEWSTVFCKAAMKAGVKTRIAHSRGANTTFSFRWLFKQMMKKDICKYATHLLAVSEVAADYLFGSNSIKQKGAEVIPNAIECSKYRFNITERDRIREMLGIDDKVVFIHVGNFTEAKNHEFLISVFAQISISENFTLLLVGGGDDRKFREMVKEKRIEEKVMFLGKRDDVNKLLFASDYFLFPSKHEGFPGAVLEAETSGLTCFISDRITSEVRIWDRVIMLPLIEEVWVSEIMINIEKDISIDREEGFERVVQAGFDIVDVSNFYLEFYKDCINS